jgi:hypothetical protein
MISHSQTLTTQLNRNPQAEGDRLGAVGRKFKRQGETLALLEVSFEE